MDPDPQRNVGHTDLSGESDSHPAVPVSVATPAVTHPGAGPSSAMVTRSRARGGREPEVEFRPETEFLPEREIPAQTDEGVSGATRHLTDIASQEVAVTQEVRTSASRLPTITRSLVAPHTGSLTSGMLHQAGRSVTSPDISGTETPIPTLSYYGDSSVVDSASRAHASVSDFAIQPHGEVAVSQSR